jgi:hypothetical protein
VQETDVFAPVRGGRIVLADDLGPRADMTASWLAQLGWDVYVLEGGFDGELETGRLARRLRRRCRLSRPSAPRDLAVKPWQTAPSSCSTSPPARSTARATCPAPGSRSAPAWPRPSSASPRVRPIVLTSPDGRPGATGGRRGRGDLRPPRTRAGRRHRGLGRRRPPPSSPGLARAASDPDDIYKRPYEGRRSTPAEAMQAYLDWEYGLVAQLARDGTHGFVVI